ncbi:cupin [Accumulibacter sp.]|uniref:cupin n=1 Tax=Accumulibacter sp. TaxID=2053492 RepID=UPI0025E87A80|nr:cupin [Accumulibacter sp.]MCM8613438.1 cupin [Accumulibacter sp.]MCM8637129.1 cupin [Accumulibacter sp.]MCM8640826.1 cupin [Accumulibacter sp.]
MASPPDATAGKLFAGLPPIGEAGEQFVQLVQRSGLLIERIVSSGQASPPGFWYDQPEAEWVLLLQGEALLRFADEDEARRLQAGDWLDIAAHRRHRVEWTAPDRLTIWLAVFYGDEGRHPAEAGRQRCEASTECLRPSGEVV